MSQTVSLPGLKSPGIINKPVEFWACMSRNMISLPRPFEYLINDYYKDSLCEFFSGSFGKKENPQSLGSSRNSFGGR